MSAPRPTTQNDLALIQHGLIEASQAHNQASFDASLLPAALAALSRVAERLTALEQTLVEIRDSQQASAGGWTPDEKLQWGPTYGAAAASRAAQALSAGGKREQ
jgi:hypothetical protein